MTVITQRQIARDVEISTASERLKSTASMHLPVRATGAGNLPAIQLTAFESEVRQQASA